MSRKNRIDQAEFASNTEVATETKEPKTPWGKISQQAQRDLAILLGSSGLTVARVYAIMDGITDNVRSPEKRAKILLAMIDGLRAPQ